MATAKKLPSGSWRCLVFSHYENLFNEDGSPMIDEKTGKQKRKRIYESFTSDLQGRRGKRDAEAQAAQFLAEKDRKKRPENWTVKEAFENYIKVFVPSRGFLFFYPISYSPYKSRAIFIICGANIFKPSECYF